MSPPDLAAAQLAAYNARDIDAFCACYAEDVTVYGVDGAPSLSGIVAFRATYAALFAAWEEFGAAVDRREADGDTVTDHERWWRSRPGPDGTPERREGRVRAVYTVRGGRIAEVHFLKEDA